MSYLAIDNTYIMVGVLSCDLINFIVKIFKIQSNNLQFVKYDILEFITTVRQK